MVKQVNDITRRSALKSALAASVLIPSGTALTGTVSAGSGNGRMGHYHLNNLRRSRGERTPGLVHDASQERNHGVNDGEDRAVVCDEGRVGRAYEFAGQSRVTIDPFTDVSGGPLTVAAWAYPLSAPRADSNVISLADRTGEGRTNSALIQHRGKDPGDPFHFAAGNGDGGYAAVKSGGINPGQWHHVALTQDGDHMRAYLDGVEVDDSPVDVTDTVGVPTNVARIAQNAIGRDVTLYNARIDEVRIYNRALTGREIGGLAAMGGE